LEENIIKRLEDEAVVIRKEISTLLHRKAMRVRICGRSKSWWTTRMTENKKMLGFMKSESRAGRTNHACVKGGRQCQQRAISPSKRWS
jgi:hypothetical protein